MLKNSSPFILELNTVILYLLAAAIAAVLLFFYIRSRLQIRRLRTSDDTGTFSRLGRSARMTRWRMLCEQYDGLSAMVQWLDTELLRRQKAGALELSLRQEWCCEDRTATAAAPVRCRPAALTLTEQGQPPAVFDRFSFLPAQYLREDEIQVLGWALLEEVRRLLPFRAYRMKTDRITRRYRVDNGVPAAWKDGVVRMENYSIRVSRR